MEELVTGDPLGEYVRLLVLLMALVMLKVRDPSCVRTHKKWKGVTRT